MRSPTHKPDDLDLDLPALDGGDDGGAEASLALDALEEIRSDGGDAFDDATGDDAPFDDVAVEGAESGWLDGAESAGTLDVGPFDLVVEPEGGGLEDEEVDARRDLDDLFSEGETLVADSGEEGPLAEDEELREEDLPALDADDDGEVADDDVYDRQMLGSEDELRWDDRAWARASERADGSSIDEVDDSGVLAAPGDDPAMRARDAAWRRLEQTGRAMAAGSLAAGAVVVAVASPDRTRALLVRIQADGQARIIAEVEPRGADDDGESCVVTFVRWDAARGCLFVGGSFGVEAYRPA